MDFFTADLHFGHADVIDRFGRPFEGADQMDDLLLANIQKRVGPDDRLWILGDFAWNRSAPLGWLENLFDHLPSQNCHLIRGNRDCPAVLSLPWRSVCEIAEISVKDGAGRDQKLVLSHYPMMTWSGAAKGALHLFGHVHSNWEGSKRAVNMGVEWWDYAPATLDEIKARAAKFPEHPMWQVLETAHDVQNR